MRRRTLVAAIAIIAGVAYFFFVHPPSPPPEPSPSFPSSALHYASHAERDFYPTLVSGVKVPTVPNVKGAIVSHHLYAEPAIARLFLAMRGQKPPVVVLIGPNHFGAGPYDIQVSRYAYETPWGRLSPHQETIDALINHHGVFQEESAFEREHSIAALVAFVRHTFPDARLVPLIVKRDVPLVRMERLAQALHAILPPGALVIASVDFSHHGSRFAAQFHDDKSVATIRSFNFESIPKLEVDSPASISLLLRYLQLRGAQKIAYTRTDSATIGGNPLSEDVTSYLFAHFLEGAPERDPAIATLHFGDIMLDRALRPKVARGLNPFEKIKGVEGNFFRGMDWIVANLEGPITEATDCAIKEIVFRFPPSTAALLKANNITVANLANNHTHDCKAAGLEDTQRHLGESGVDFFGTGLGDAQIATKAVEGKTIAFLGAELIYATPARLGAFLTAVSAARQGHDHVIAHVHWGNEYQRLPSAAQREMGRKIIDAGADVIIGHHPHVIEPAELYKGGVIFYSLGNFVFDQYIPGTKEGIGVGVVQPEGLTRLTVFPFDIVAYQPQLKSLDEALETCAFVLGDIPVRDGCAFEVRTP